MKSLDLCLAPFVHSPSLHIVGIIRGSWREKITDFQGSEDSSKLVLEEGEIRRLDSRVHLLM